MAGGALTGDKRLVIDLGLQTKLSEYKVPEEALVSVAEGALGSQNQNYELSRVVKLLETVLQSLTQMRTLSIVDDSPDLATAVEARTSYTKARRFGLYP